MNNASGRHVMLRAQRELEYKGFRCTHNIFLASTRQDFKEVYFYIIFAKSSLRGLFSLRREQQLVFERRIFAL